MLPREHEHDSAEWLRFARSSMALGSVAKIEAVRWEDLCYQLQQAGEKALKAVFIAHGLNFRYTHDLEELITGLRHQHIKVPRALNEAAILTQYATESRYPGFDEPVSEEEFMEARKLAENVLAWAEQVIAGIAR